MNEEMRFKKGRKPVSVFTLWFVHLCPHVLVCRNNTTINHTVLPLLCDVGASDSKHVLVLMGLKKVLVYNVMLDKC